VTFDFFVLVVFSPSLDQNNWNSVETFKGQWKVQRYQQGHQKTMQWLNERGQKVTTNDFPNSTQKTEDWVTGTT